MPNFANFVETGLHRYAELLSVCERNDEIDHILD